SRRNTVEIPISREHKSRFGIGGVRTVERSDVCQCAIGRKSENSSKSSAVTDAGHAIKLAIVAEDQTGGQIRDIGGDIGQPTAWRHAQDLSLEGRSAVRRRAVEISIRRLDQRRRDWIGSLLEVEENLRLHRAR